MLALILIAVILMMADAIAPGYADVTRAIMAEQKSPDWVTIEDAVQRGTLAFTSADRQHIYVDFNKFRGAPHTLQSVLKHEIAHSHGHDHGDGSPYMDYAVTVDEAGNVIDDAAVLP